MEIIAWGVVVQVGAMVVFGLVMSVRDLVSRRQRWSACTGRCRATSWPRSPVTVGAA